LKKSLAPADRGLRYEPGGPNVWLFVGVNGVGKTTTIGKVAHQQQAEGRSTILAAADTFRAAAAEQLDLWAHRVGAPLVRGAEAGGVTGRALSKLDGAAKGGIARAIQNGLSIPIKRVGLGETVEELMAFDPEQFVEALFE